MCRWNNRKIACAALLTAGAFALCASPGAARESRATSHGLHGARRQLHGARQDLDGVRRLLSVPFGFASAALEDPARRRLGLLARTLAARPRVRIVVAGHADAIGAAASNQHLSASRARAVCRELRRLLGRERRCTALAFGEGAPVAPNCTPDGRDDRGGRARNRRAHVFLRGAARRSADRASAGAAARTDLRSCARRASSRRRPRPRHLTTR
jgi:outer membrane protein OmpA-like peptidoglycan-associated protein